MCDNVLSNKHICGSNHSVKGIETSTFYGRKKIKHLDIKHLRRKHNLCKVERYVSSKKSADALALRNYGNKKNCSRNGSIITSHPTHYNVFSKQEEAIKFSIEKVRFV